MLDTSKVKVKMNAAAAVIVKEGENGEKLMLLIQRASDDHWPLHFEFPRGKCDKGSTPLGENLLACCRREVKEETGLDVIPLFKIDEFQYVADQGTRLTTCHNFLCKMKNPDQKVKLSKEHDNYKWIQSVGEAEMMVFPDQKKTIGKIFNTDIKIVNVPQNDFTKNNQVEENKMIDDYLNMLNEGLGDRPDPPKKWPAAKKRKFYRDKMAAARKHMKRAQATKNVGWVKMLNKRMKQYQSGLNSISEAEKKDGSPCWKGYTMVGWKMKDGKKVPNCVPMKKGDPEPMKPVKEAEEKENKPLNKPFRMPSGSPKKFGVYVKNDKGNVVKVTFGDPNLEIKRDDPDRLRSFRARHGCDNPGPKWKAKYWSCRFWEKGISVTQLLKGKK